MSVDLISPFANLIMYAFIVCTVAAGMVTAAVAFTAWFRLVIDG